MGRKKHIKIKQAGELPNVFSFGDQELAEKINSFCNADRKYTLELGCGHGDYSIELAALHPERNFLGIDLKAARIYTGAKRAIELNLKNVAFLIAPAEKLMEIFPQSSIMEIYIPFPDPHYKRRKEPRRLVSGKFFEVYKSILVEGGKVHLKTDNEMIYSYTLKTIEDFGCKVIYSIDDLYSKINHQIPVGIITKYERHYLKEGKKIKYICFSFN